MTVGEQPRLDVLWVAFNKHRVVISGSPDSETEAEER